MIWWFHTYEHEYERHTLKSLLNIVVCFNGSAGFFLFSFSLCLYFFVILYSIFSAVMNVSICVTFEHPLNTIALHNKAIVFGTTAFTRFNGFAN